MPSQPVWDLSRSVLRYCFRAATFLSSYSHPVTLQMAEIFCSHPQITAATVRCFISRSMMIHLISISFVPRCCSVNGCTVVASGQPDYQEYTADLQCMASCGSQRNTVLSMSSCCFASCCFIVIKYKMKN
jgi:hypothetical protein